MLNRPIFKSVLHNTGRRHSSGMPGHVLFPTNCPFAWDLNPRLIHRLFHWANPSVKSKRHLDQFSRFCATYVRVSSGMSFPHKIAPSHGGMWPPSNTWLILWAHLSPQPKRHLDRFSRFA